jgi:apolipoprotein N-acyltransferase
VFPLTVTTVDWATSHIEFLGSYGSPAYTQAGDLPLLQVVSVTGISRLIFLVHWLAPVANELWEHASDWRASRVSVGLFASTIVAVLLFGGVRLAFVPPTGPTLRVAALADTRERYRAVDPPFFLLQPGTSDERASFRAQAAPFLDELFERTEQQARAGAQVVSWFEDAAIILKEDEPAAIERGRELARRQGIYLEMGLLVILSSDRYRQSLIFGQQPTSSRTPPQPVRAHQRAARAGVPRGDARTSSTAPPKPTAACQPERRPLGTPHAGWS